MILVAAFDWLLTAAVLYVVGTQIIWPFIWSRPCFPWFRRTAKIELPPEPFPFPRPAAPPDEPDDPFTENQPPPTGDNG